MFIERIKQLFRRLKNSSNQSSIDEYDEYKEELEGEEARPPKGISFGFMISTKNAEPFLLINDTSKNFVNIMSGVLKDIADTELGVFYIRFLEKYAEENPQFEYQIQEIIESVNSYHSGPLVCPTEVFGDIF